MQTFRSKDRRRISYWEEGRGPVLVMHPGGPGLSTAQVFGEFCGLENHLTLIKFNPRGASETDGPDDPQAYTVSDYVADIEELRQHLELDRISLLGHSHGGIVAATYASEYPDHVDRLVLSATRVRTGPDDGAWMKSSDLRKGREPWFADAWEAAELLRGGTWQTDEELGRLVIRSLPLSFGHYGEREAAFVYSHSDAWAYPWGEAYRYQTSHPWPSLDQTGVLARIQAPTLVFQGDADPLVPLENAERLGAGISGARVVMLPGVGHPAPWIEAHDRVRAEMLTFFSLT